MYVMILILVMDYVVDVLVDIHQHHVYQSLETIKASCKNKMRMGMETNPVV